MSSWYCAAHCCFQHGEPAWAAELCLPVPASVHLETSHLKIRIYVVWAWGFADPSELQCSESPGGAACQRLILMGEGSVVLEMSGKEKEAGNRFLVLYLWRQKLS